MAWRRYPFESIWHEMEDMRAEMERMFSQVQEEDGFFPPVE